MDSTDMLARVTVVVPVGPGDAMSPRLRARLATLPSQVRVVHADAVPAISTGIAATGSRLPPTEPPAMEIRKSPRWDIISAARGRATQQNAGARGAEGGWLWFLHADSEVAPRTLPALVRFIEAHDGRDALGYFDLRFLDDGPPLMRLNAMGAWIRSHGFGLPFGDQGLLLRRETFERIGGFDPGLACGEDHDLVWRLRRAGVPPRPVGAPLFTSARKYAERGWAATTAWHLRETWRQARRFAGAEAAR